MKKKLIIILIALLGALVIFGAVDFLITSDEYVLIGDETEFVDRGSLYEEKGIAAYKINCITKIKRPYNYEIQGNIGSDLGSYEVRYIINNEEKTELVRKVIVWNSKGPTITLLGGENQNITDFKPYQDPGFSAIDAYGKDISADVVVTGKVRGAIATQSADGKQLLDPYVLTYTYTGEDGKITSVERTVNIIAPAAPVANAKIKNALYITFDDGPNAYTAQLLDILKSNDIKVTFFVTGNETYRDLIGRAYREGHVIGAHCYLHEYNSVYASVEAYLDDMQKIQDVIYEQTGSYTRLIRFPGGTSNTVSKKTPGLMTTLSELMPKMGFQYFDWNAACGDGASPTQEETIELFKYYVERQSESIMLCHDTKRNTVSVMDGLLKWVKTLGKDIRTLDLTTYPHHHKPNN